ncbi:MAG: 50S ribosomal protein L3 [Candidatus Yanofskybacteria bacterium RIFCSPHIGHO2_01_FULL_43_42]|uniref:Large ribosomal subunit protein uL3 n=1 Tax=Candidatus Yanofskybacteria bacterium RIFCSPLOWO2_01_FULL_43_22 TaxID=1802695 RepID=A0A1F8GGZ6_9BACT|nr:MAG: 50S ribosomal protein L3 [Candidatus Yanofskybacteria bacterium RIFCSPHIGHO2_01_FULL_43_42]OGN12572.1 MAG: 50S ribosomal protein L3 [Candidatus Yanofskybacteria bacterium RIFCSPHIGHO2_02_FULL_43_17]OGN23719.1 MAG: 50S ribosomal protein L3 [Candidatus Yanofskybacteria bacterium RIFCSPLOWO2_01_FULL_43_22]
MKFILGKKLGMSQIFKEDGTVIPVTVIEAEPNMITQIKTKEKDGYEAVQVGVGLKKKTNKPKFSKEFNLENKGTKARGKASTTLGDLQLAVGQKIDLSIFSEGDVVKISGLSKGKGFQGVVKRHGFSGMPFSHGHHHVLRHGGSIGQRFPQHTLKGMRMAGRMGGVRATTRGLKVVKVDAENNLIAVKGAVPGHKGGLVIVQTQSR